MSHLLSGLGIDAFAELESYVLERGDLRSVLVLWKIWEIDAALVVPVKEHLVQLPFDSLLLA